MPSPRFDPTSLGNLAVASGKVSRETILQAFAVQLRRPEVKVGELLVELGALTGAERDALLAQQERVRGGHPTTTDVMQLADYAVECVSRAADKLTKLGG